MGSFKGNRMRITIIILFIYLFIHGCIRSYLWNTGSFIAGSFVVASFVAVHGFFSSCGARALRLSSCGAQAPEHMGSVVAACGTLVVERRLSSCGAWA